MTKSTKSPGRLFRCRLEELGPLDGMVQAMFTANKADFGKASPDYAAAGYLPGWEAKRGAFRELVPTGVRRATDKEVTREMTQLAKKLRDPLNWLNIRLNRVGKQGGLTTAVDDFGLSRVRAEISTRDMEGLDAALNHLIQLLQTPANEQALAAQGHTADDTAAFTAARTQISAFNVEQNSNQNSALELTEENIRAGNALWEYLVDVLATGNLMYKETNPTKAKTFSMATLLKRVRKENGKDAGDAPPAA